MKRLGTVNDSEEAHVQHVPLGKRGLLLINESELTDDSWETSHILADGTHRARRCMRDGKPFPVYMLDAETSRRFMFHSMTELLISMDVIRLGTLGVQIGWPLAGEVFLTDDRIKVAQIISAIVEKDMEVMR